MTRPASIPPRPTILALFATVCWANALVHLVDFVIPRYWPGYVEWYGLVSRPLRALSWQLYDVTYLPWRIQRLFDRSFLTGDEPPSAVALGLGLSVSLGWGLWKLAQWVRIPTLILLASSACLEILTVLGQQGRPAEIPGPFLHIVTSGFVTRLVSAVAILLTLFQRDARADKTSNSIFSERARAALIASALLLGLLTGVWVLARHALPGNPARWWSVLWVNLPALALFVAWRVKKRLDSMALGLALGLGVSELLFFAPRASPANLVALGYFLGGATWIIVTAALVALLCVGVASWLAWRAREVVLPQIGATAFAFSLPFAAMSVTASWLEWSSSIQSVFTVVPSDLGPATERNQREITDRKRVRTIASCAFLFAQRHPDQGLPSDLGGLGPQGTGCLSADILAARNAYFFDPGVLGDGTRAKFMVATIAPAPMPGEPLWIDGDGVVGHGASTYSRVVGLLRNLRACIQRSRNATPGNRYPMDLTPVVRLRANSDECVRFDGESRIRTWRAGEAVRYADYELVYSPSLGPDRMIVGYQIHASPTPWGDLHFRSYVMDESGIIRGTPLHRMANKTDPPVTNCEVSDPLGPKCESGPPPSK